jgi:hypothetical protein
VFKRLAIAVMLLIGAASAQNSFYTDRAVATLPLNGGKTALGPIQYGQVRVCNNPAVGSPCSNPATVFDINNNPLSIVGGNFGQITTDVVGRFSFQTVPGSYVIQVAPSGSNTPQLNYPVTVSPFTLSGQSILAGNNNFIGSNTFQFLNNIRFADLFTGADWCAKVTAADANLGSTAGEIWVSQGAGTSACAAAPTLSTYHTLHFIQAGVYPIAVGWTITSQHDFGIIGEPGTVLSFTGSAGFTIDGSALGNGSRRNLVRGIIFSGNASVADAFTLNKVVESEVEYVTAMNATGTAFKCLGCLGVTFISPRSSTNNNLGPVTYSTIPAIGMKLDVNGGAISSNANHIINPWFEGLTGGKGIQILNGSNNVISGGTSEANAVGVDFNSSTAADNSLYSIDLEANSTMDITCSGPRNSFYDVRAFSGTSTSGINLLSGCTNASFDVGRYYQLTAASGATDGQVKSTVFHNLTLNAGANGWGLHGITYSVNGSGGAFTNSATNTLSIDVRNLFTGNYDEMVFSGNQPITVAPPDVGASVNVGWKWCILASMCWGLENNAQVIYNGSNAFVSIFGSSLPVNDATGLIPDSTSKITFVPNTRSIFFGQQLVFSGTTPTISSGFGTSPSVTVSNGATAFRVNVGTGGTASAGVIGVPTASVGWNCAVGNLTAHAGNRADDTVQTASTATTVSVQNQTKSTGAAVAWTASDIVTLQCAAY